MTKIYHAHLYGSREDKYRYLEEHDVTTVDWQELNPQSPFYLFIPQNTDLRLEYDNYWEIPKIFTVNTLGFQTHRDHFAIDFDREILRQRFQDFRERKFSNDEIKHKYNIKDNRDWQVETARTQIRADENWETGLINCLYRPFDWRPCYYSAVAMDRPRTVLQQNMIKENLSLNIVRQTKLNEWGHALVANTPTPALYVEIKDGSNVFPLYTYPDTQNEQGNLFVEKSANFAKKFLTAISEKQGYLPTPEAIFYYIYAILHSPTYRQRYAEFLKIDFPRIPLTSNDQLFKDLGTKGEELVNLHLMKSKKLNKLITKVGGEGDNAVTEVTYQAKEQRVYINKTRYFEGIAPELWDFKIGGYQVLDKWLKDRKKANRILSFDEVLHYQKIAIALKETMQLMAEIDRLIPGFPIH